MNIFIRIQMLNIVNLIWIQESECEFQNISIKIHNHDIDHHIRNQLNSRTFISCFIILYPFYIHLNDSSIFLSFLISIITYYLLKITLFPWITLFAYSKNAIPLLQQTSLLLNERDTLVNTSMTSITLLLHFLYPWNLVIHLKISLYLSKLHLIIHSIFLNHSINIKNQLAKSKNIIAHSLNREMGSHITFIQKKIVISYILFLNFINI